MKIETNGILIKITPFGEKDIIANFFTEKYGILSGIIKYGLVSKKKIITGQKGKIIWNARLESQLGVIKFEDTQNIIAKFLTSSTHIQLINSVFSLILKLIPERENYSDLYNNTLLLLDKIYPTINLSDYINFEINLIKNLGFAFDFSKCSCCGTNKNLNYMSPKTYKTVCDKCIQPYLNQAIKLPLTLYDLENILTKICINLNTTLPNSRKTLKI